MVLIVSVVLTIGEEGLLLFLGFICFETVSHSRKIETTRSAHHSNQISRNYPSRRSRFDRTLLHINKPNGVTYFHLQCPPYSTFRSVLWRNMRPDDEYQSISIRPRIPTKQNLNYAKKSCPTHQDTQGVI